MRRLMFVPILMLGLAAASPSLAQDAPERRVTVTGEGGVSAVPDLATITVGVNEQGQTATDALRANTRAMQALFDVLDTAGIEGADRQTSGLNLQPIYDHSTTRAGEAPQIVGYEASNTLMIRVTKLDLLGDVLDSVTVAGANRISGISFGLSDTEAMMEEARRAAVQDAMARAQLYVETAGATLGQVITISESGGRSPSPMPEMAMMRMSADTSVPIAEGEVGLSVRVNVVFEIE